MPAPKAVLRDIADFGLDPQAPHVRCTSTGRLSALDTTLAALLPLVVACPTTAIEPEVLVEPTLETLAPFNVPVRPPLDTQPTTVAVIEAKKPVVRPKRNAPA